MKNLILIIAVIVLSACASVPTIKSVAGTYEYKDDRNIARFVLLENGNWEDLHTRDKGTWEISIEGKLHIIYENSNVMVWRINEDSSITVIETIGRLFLLCEYLKKISSMILFLISPS